MRFSIFKRYFVGGVNSPVRSFKDVGATPFIVKRAIGAYLYDVNGKKYIDFVLAWGPSILGHADRYVLDGIKKVMESGLSFGAPHILEVELAGIIKKAIPLIELMRFVNSGTEATMSAIRLARGYNERDFIVKFEGCYHGHSDFLLKKSGSGMLTYSAMKGVPEGAIKTTILLPYNDSQALEQAFKKYGDRIAAVIVEPVCGNMGVVIPRAEFIIKLNELVNKYKSVLISDEVITGFRFSFGASSDILGLKPHLMCLGKIVGGGLPFAVYGGKKEIMENLAPDGDVYQAGTLAGNPVAVAGAYYTLKRLKALMPYKKLTDATKKIIDLLRIEFAKKGIPVTINSFGSMFTVFFTGMAVYDLNSAKSSDRNMYARFFKLLLKNGVYFPPSQFEACFVSVKHIEIMDEILERMTAAIRMF